MPTQETTGSSPDTETTGAIQSASEMKAGDRVVYPKQGVCRVLGLESKEIAGQRLEFVSMAREEDNATILVPVPKVASIGLRKVADTTELADVFDLLASSFDDPELDWKVRHRLHGDLLSAGGILGVAEVLKALQGLANLRPLPQKERERYDTARHLLVAEVTVALGVPAATSEDFIDLALLPPPGTVRPARKPRRLAVVTPRPKPAIRGRARGEGEEFEEEEELGLEDELGFEEEEAAPEEEAEGAEGEAEEEEAPRAAAPARKAAKPKSAKPRAAKPRATKPKPDGEAKAEKAAKAKARPPATEAAAGEGVAAEAAAPPEAVAKAPP
ncbi:MAG TPA: CarD family transcriptional regulator, partial [Vulgatibacter sp.]